MCSCDAEFKHQPVAVDNVVTHPPTETNQITSDNVDDTKSEVAGSVVDENSTGIVGWQSSLSFPLVVISNG